MEKSEDKEKEICKMSFRFHSVKKLFNREEDDHPSKTAIKNSITKKLSKVKANRSGKQVSFSKKIEQIPQTLSEIKKTIVTPQKITTSSTKYKPTKEHVKTPFRLRRYKNDSYSKDKFACQLNLFCSDDNEENINNKSGENEKDSDSEENNNKNDDNINDFENDKSIYDSDSVNEDDKDEDDDISNEEIDKSDKNEEDNEKDELN